MCFSMNTDRVKMKIRNVVKCGTMVTTYVPISQDSFVLCSLCLLYYGVRVGWEH